MLFDVFHEQLTAYFDDRNWHLKRCRKCGRTFLTKTDNGYCGRLECMEQPILGERRQKAKQADEVLEHMRQYFKGKGYYEKILPNVNNPQKDTAFVVAAVQLYNQDLEQDALLDERPILCPQPCLRLKPFPPAYSQQGFLYSFVNAATLKLNTDMAEYCLFLDDWVGYLSAIGVHASRIRIVLCENYVNIRDLYFGWGVDVNIDGLELGHCNFYDRVVSADGRETTGIDCGFCMERLLWVINRGAFWDNLLPKDEAGFDGIHLEFEDILRSIVLIVMSGIRPGARNGSYRLKQLLNQLALMDSEWMLIDRNIDHYFSFWQLFLGAHLSCSECKSVIYGYLRKRHLKVKSIKATCCN